jgi:hypothetical protein
MTIMAGARESEGGRMQDECKVDCEGEHLERELSLQRAAVIGGTIVGNRTGVAGA